MVMIKSWSAQYGHENDQYHHVFFITMSQIAHCPTHNHSRSWVITVGTYRPFNSHSNYREFLEKYITPKISDVMTKPLQNDMSLCYCPKDMMSQMQHLNTDVMKRNTIHINLISYHSSDHMLSSIKPKHGENTLSCCANIKHFNNTWVILLNHHNDITKSQAMSYSRWSHKTKELQL